MSSQNLKILSPKGQKFSKNPGFNINLIHGIKHSGKRKVCPKMKKRFKTNISTMLPEPQKLVQVSTDSVPKLKKKKVKTSLEVSQEKQQLMALHRQAFTAKIKSIVASRNRKLN